MVYSLAHGRAINVGNLMMKELIGRLGKSPKKRGNEIFFPRFIQSILNYKNNAFIKIEGIKAQRIGYSKTMSKVLFGSSDTKNQVDVPLGITPHMRVIFDQYPVAQPIYFSLFVEKAYLNKAAHNHSSQDVPNPSINPSSTPLVVSNPSASCPQKSEVTKKKWK